MDTNPSIPGPCPPGYLPSWIYDQSDCWIDANGKRQPLDSLELPELLKALSLIEEKADEAWLFEVEVFLHFLRHERELGVPKARTKRELGEVRRLLSLGPKGWLKEKQLPAALLARANRMLAAK